ncbi:MAG TPA: FGGY-family carbohydrate kinase [Thermotogota bacterium]|nr:FGGY-family carbohydrate kinase [Thermotogota bacterium]HPJ90209.1 FGGY-family carbohydrate kinase [Thermotogota bacterium]HPR97412.1 FGGY-family carbohydrate kinase [Thermotogota bacterium]
MYLIGTDIGTQGTKTVIVDEKGQIKSESFREYAVLTPRPSWAHQWPDVWVRAVCGSIKEALEKLAAPSSEIAALAISGLYGGSGIAVDKSVNPLYPCLIWMDRRAKKQTAWVKKNLSQERIFEITGNYTDSYYGYTKIMWIRENEPDIWSQTWKFVTPKDFVIYKLTGDMTIDYSSAGNLGGLFDIHEKKWSEEMCEMLGIPIEKLPETIIRSTDIAGKINKTGAELTGLDQGTPIISSGIDAAVAQFSAGVVDEGEHVAMAGTSMCWGTVHDGKNLHPGLISFPYVVYETEKIYTFGGSATNGALARWFRDQFGIIEKEVEKRTGLNAYALFEDEIKDIPPGSNGLIALPYFMGERSPIWDPDARGGFLGLSLYHERRHMYKALLEAAAYSLRDNMELAREANIRLNNECCITGGVAKSKMWVQIFADVTGYDMKLIKNSVEAPLGDAFLAGLGVKLFDRPEEIKQWLEFEEIVRTNRTNKKEYDRYYKYFKEFYCSTKMLMMKMAEERE